MAIPRRVNQAKLEAAMRRAPEDAARNLNKLANESPPQAPYPNDATKQSFESGNDATDLSGVEFGLIINGRIIDDFNQVTQAMIEQWAAQTWEQHQRFASSVAGERPAMPFNWTFPRLLTTWLRAMFKSEV